MRRYISKRKRKFGDELYGREGHQRTTGVGSKTAREAECTWRLITIQRGQHQSGATIVGDNGDEQTKHKETESLIKRALRKMTLSIIITYCSLVLGESGN